MKTRVTIKDVARTAGVSVTTASRAIRGRPDISPATRDKILRIADDLGYYPSALARGLVSGRSMTIGLLVSDITNPFYPKLARPIEDSAYEQDYTVVLCDTDDNPVRSRRYVERLLSQRIDGIIHAAVGRDEPIIQMVRDAGVPLVLTNRRSREIEGLDVVVPDYVAGGRRVTEYLVRQGRRRILHLMGPEYASSSREVTEGHLQALTDLGVGVDSCLILPGSFKSSSGYERTRAFLSTHQPPDAIFAVDDFIALGAMDALADMGLRVPEDVAVVGFDDVDISSSKKVQLTSVNLNLERMGKLAWELLFDAIQNPETHVPKQIFTETELVIRASSESI